MTSRSTATIVHLSDLHIRSDPYGCNDFDEGLNHAGLKAQNLVAYINNRYPDAHIVMTGDLTDSGTPGSLQEVRRIFNDWLRPSRLSVVLGNHDCGTHGNFFLPERVRDFHRTMAPTARGSFRHPWVKWLQPMVLIGLDSNAEATDVILACGKLGDRQLGWLDRFLAELPPMWFPVILLHHHPFDESIGTRLVDADGFRSCINRRLKGRKSLVLFGHKHGSDKLRRSGATYFQSPSSVVSDRNRLRFRVLTVSHQGIEDTWDGCKVPKT